MFFRLSQIFQMMIIKQFAVIWSQLYTTIRSDLLKLFEMLLFQIMLTNVCVLLMVQQAQENRIYKIIYFIY